MSVEYTCDGCGKKAAAHYNKLGDPFKPREWFERCNAERALKALRARLSELVAKWEKEHRRHDGSYQYCGTYQDCATALDDLLSPAPAAPAEGGRQLVGVDDYETAYYRSPPPAPAEKAYTEKDMRECFEESRLTNPFVGFKHDTFDDFLSRRASAGKGDI